MPTTMVIPYVDEFLSQISLNRRATCLPCSVQSCSAKPITILTTIVGWCLTSSTRWNTAIFLTQKSTQWNRVFNAMTKCCCVIGVYIKVSRISFTSFPAKLYGVLFQRRFGYFLVNAAVYFFRGLDIAVWYKFPNISFGTDDTTSGFICTGIPNPDKFSIFIQFSFNTFSIRVKMTNAISDFRFKPNTLSICT